jgi:hypothetical protein
MIQVTIEVKGNTVSQRVRVTAPNVEQALELAGASRPDKRVRVVFPIEPEAFFTGDRVPAGVSLASPGLEQAA